MLSLYATLLIPCLLGVESSPFKDTSLAVVGGESASINEVPYMARLHREGNGGWFCAAVIIHEKFLISSSLCYYTNPSSMTAASYYVIVGTDKARSGGEEYAIENIYHHPFHLSKGFLNQYQILLLELAQPLVFNERVKSIPLAKKGVLPENAIFEIVGFGVVSLDKDKRDFEMSKDLQKASMSHLPLEKCRTCNNDYTDMICAGADGKGMCFYDEGAPLVYNGTLLGISTIFSMGCGKQPSLYTYIPGIRDFIDYVMRSND